MQMNFSYRVGENRITCVAVGVTFVIRFVNSVRYSMELLYWRLNEKQKI